MEYYRCKDLSSRLGRKAFSGFFGRQGGLSRNVFSSLNCGRGSSDDPAHVKANLAVVATEVGVEPSHLLTLHQTHSADCLVVDDVWDLNNRPQADAMVTKVPGIALGVLTADCAPVLLYGEDEEGAPVVGAAHAGWGGAFKGVLDSTVAKMLEVGAVQDSLIATIGPCITQESYEVGAEFRERFVEDNADNDRFFKTSDTVNHYMFDLPGYCRMRLEAVGVSSVFCKGLDTYYNEEDFFSYRRATHRKEADYGRQISVISICE